MNRRVFLSLFCVILVASSIICGVVFIPRLRDVVELKLNYSPQSTKLFNIGNNNDPIDVPVTTLPQFSIKLSEEKFANLWHAQATGREKAIEVSAINAKGDAKLSVNTQFDNVNKQVILTPAMANRVKPGLYTLGIKVKTVQGQYETITQDFSWGVLAINTNKGVYQVGEKVSVGMAVLDDFGTTKCIAKEEKVQPSTAKVYLTITSPSGKTQKLSTNDGTITGSPECADKSVTNKPDFLAKIDALEPGQYKIEMLAETILGQKIMTHSFNVQEQAPKFVIERTEFPTRIYPRSDYPVTISVTPMKNYNGPVTDILPKEFTITGISDYGDTQDKGNFRTILWNVNWKAGITYKLSYTIKFPRISPEFYLIGPMTMEGYKEEMEWQVASDSLFTFVQEKHTTGTGTAVNLTLDSTPVTGNVLIDICYRVSSGSFSTPNTGSGWSTAYSNSSSAPRIYMFYRTVTAGTTKTVGCRVTSSTTMGVQVLEFNGISSAGAIDSRNRRNAFSCTTSNANTNLTPTNPDVLAVGAYAALKTTSVSGHSTLTDSATSFNPASGTFDSAYLEEVNNPPVATANTATYAVNTSSTCANVLVHFNPSLSISQGSYRFFDNANSITPGGPLANVNQIMQLGFPNYPFRIRFLLDVDSPGGSTLPQFNLDYQLEYATLSADLATCGDITQWDLVSTSANGTDIAFYTNPDSGGNGTLVGAVAGDPTDGGYTTTTESYYEDDINGNAPIQTGDITNDSATALANNRAGLWDLSLVDNTDDAYSRHYCLRIVENGGALLDAYRNYPQVITVKSDVTIRGGSTIRGSTTIK